MPINKTTSGGTRKTGASGRATTVKKTEKAEAKPAAGKAKKPDSNFAGTTKDKASKPAAQLPRSGWGSGAAFADAVKNSRDLTGLKAGGLGERPVIRPLYGIVFPVPIDPNLKDHHLEAAAKQMLGDRKISVGEVNNLISIAKSNGHLSKTEKKDLQRLMDNAGQYFDADALRTLQAFVKNDKPMPDPVIRPLYGLNFPIPIPADIKDKKLTDALKTELADRHISLDDVNNLIKIANANGGLSAHERADLGRVYDELKPFMDDDAHFKLGQAIGREPVIRPLYGIVFPIPMPDLKDKKLEDALREVLGDRHITLGEVNTLIDNAKANNGLSVTERKDLQKILAADGKYMDADAQTALKAFLAHPSSENPHISTGRRDAILAKVESSNLEWKSGFPLGERMVEVPLSHAPAGGADMYQFTAMIPVGALAPGAKTIDPEGVKDMWIRRSGGFAGQTEYAHLHVD